MQQGVTALSVLARRAIASWVALAVIAAPAWAGDDAAVQAGFVLNLAKYVKWPADRFQSETDPYSICVIEDRELAAKFSAALDGRTVRKRAFAVETITGAEQALTCHVLFAARSQRTAARSLAHELRGESVLTVAEYDRFAHVGGVIGLDMVRGKISFEINRSVATRGGLTVSSKLLRLATSVR